MTKKWLGFVVWGLLALPMISIVLTSYLLAPIITPPLFVRRDAAGREQLVRWLYYSGGICSISINTIH